MPSPYLNVDLHSHSTYSDGTLPPAALAACAHQGGVDLWALTDHDEIAGQTEACAAAHALGMDYLTGVEISASYAGHTVHIVGLGFDATHEGLREGLHALRHSRAPRAREMARQLELAGIAGAYEGALRYVGNPDLISRTHFARHLVDIGVCSDMADVFRRYLTEGKPGFVPQRWASVTDAVGWITAAQGVAVIAHPARYSLPPMLEDALFQQFIECGGRGVEVVCGGHAAHEAVRYAESAHSYRLLASRGSDFHSPQESRVAPGNLPALPSSVQPVWQALAQRIQRAPGSIH